MYCTSTIIGKGSATTYFGLVRISISLATTEKTTIIGMPCLGTGDRANYIV